MSKIPVGNNGPTEMQQSDIKKQSSCRSFASLIPKKKEDTTEVTKSNPRILDLRLKLDEITKKQEHVDKKTKSLINGITRQLVDEKDQSGPYSLLFDLQPDSSTSCTKDLKQKTSTWKSMDNVENTKVMDEKGRKISNDSLNRVEKLPNVIHFDKPMKEFEYSCETQVSFPVVKNGFNIHSRSELCLNLKSYVFPKSFEQNMSPNDHSISRPNEENSLDDSLGILTPDQMDDMCFLENAFSPTVENLPIFCDSESKETSDNGDTPSTEKTESQSAASTIQNDGMICDEYKSNSSRQAACIIPTVDIHAVHEYQIMAPTKSCPNVDAKNNEPQKDESRHSFIQDEFMASIHSSILEPASSIAETTANLDLPLDGKAAESHLSNNRIEQTPSPEDLPLDNSDINGEISSYSNSQYSTSILQDSHTFSDVKNEPKSIETSKVSNSFITSITSITSLDGYQGDGEMSRPVSRGADHSIREEAIEMDWQNIPVTRRADPMTDSDFFTESDADGLDDQIQRGDRRAQVIDGALYGGKNGNGNHPLIVNNRSEDSCMESSGVYTDFETHRTSPVFLNVIDDVSPEGSTPSTHSEFSQKNVNMRQVIGFSSFDDTLRDENNSNISTAVEEDTPRNSSKRSSIRSEVEVKVSDKFLKEEKRSFTLKKYKMPKRDVPSKLKSMLSSRKTDTDLSVQSSPKITKKNERRESMLKKNEINKGDYKMKSFKDIKSKVDCSFSLQRSQTTCNVSRMLSAKSNVNTKPKSRHMRMRMELGSAAGSGKSSLHSSQSDISALSTPGKLPPARYPLLRNGKKRESAPPPPTPARSTPAPAASPLPPPAQVKKNGVVQKLAASPVTLRARSSLAAQPPPSPRKPAPRRMPAQRPTTLPTNNKESPRVTTAVGPRSKRVQTPQPTRTPNAPLVTTQATPTASRDQTLALAHASKGVEALGVLVQYLVFRLDALNGDAWRVEAERWRGVAAAERSSATRADLDRQQRAQKDLDTITECLNKISELEIEVSAKEEANAHLQATHVAEVAELASDIKGLKKTIESLKKEVAESRSRLQAHSDVEHQLRLQLEVARAEISKQSANQSLNQSYNQSYNQSAQSSEAIHELSCSKSCTMCDAACDPVCCEAEECEIRLRADEELSNDANELAAEVRSLRAVVELKQAEVAALRGARSELTVERERRVAAEREACTAAQAAEELKERAAARQRDVDRLRDDNRRLRDVAARDRDHATRLAALNEELRYKLRQKTQVVSLLAGGAYLERPAMRTRTSSCDSARSPSPPPDSPPSPASSPAPDTPPLPAVKGVVEKHDSVSWVLEIEESPEEVATRLARRSSFRTNGNGNGGGSGVKRRGGGSPGSGSPAPASPAPNASKLFRPGELDFPPPPPPLKESAGEAIYIYDDRQY